MQCLSKLYNTSFDRITEFSKARTFTSDLCSRNSVSCAHSYRYLPCVGIDIHAIKNFHFHQDYSGTRLMTSVLTVLYDDLLKGEQVDVLTMHEGLLKGEQVNLLTMHITFASSLSEN